MKENGRQRGTVSEAIRRELRVVGSRNRSPLPLRLAKWALFLAITRRLYGTRWFRVWVLGLPLAGLATHLLYRHETRGWTRPWGGWKDLEAANPKKC
jgi:hypothetical protein